MRERRPNRVLGKNDEQFWSYCAQDELRLQRCQACSHISWPPGEACERCGAGRLRWERLSGHGQVISWCTFEKRYYDELPVPWDTILVRLREGPLFISNPLGFTGDETELNMPVVVRFIDCEDDAGPFRLPVFAKET